VKVSSGAVCVFVTLMLCLSVFQAPIVEARLNPSVQADALATLEGSEVTFTVNPDGDIEVEAKGSFREDVEEGNPSPATGVSIDLSLTPSGENLTKVEGGCVVNMDASYSPQLSAMVLDVKLHGDESNGSADVTFSLPGYVSVDGSITGTTKEFSDFVFDFSVRLWYSAVPREGVQDIVDNFPSYKSMLITQVSKTSNGNIVVQDLSLVESSFGEEFASLRVKGRISGDLRQVFTLMMESTNVSAVGDLEELTPVEVKSYDLAVKFDKVECAFKVDFNGVVEGDVDELAERWKDYAVAELRERAVDPAMHQMLIDLATQSKVSVANLKVSFDYIIVAGVVEGSYSVDGFAFTPPTGSMFTAGLNEALVGVSLPESTLTIMGGADDHHYVEVGVPEATSKPTEQEVRMAAWEVDGLVGLDKVTFTVRSWPTPSVSLSQGSVVTGDQVKFEGMLTQDEKPLPDTLVTIFANGNEIGSTQTDGEGRFTYSYEFGSAGSYDVKSTVNFEGKNVESQPAKVTVENPPIVPPSLVMPLVSGVLVLAAVLGYFLVKRRKTPVLIQPA
jgi:hypothetical protein